MIKKKSVNISGHRTSISIEEQFWQVLKEISEYKKKSINSLIFEIDKKRNINTNLSSAIRLFVLNYIRNN
ncbi:MAG: aryl-sulfate sulfotransferase [Rhodospirillaceae bacterium]|nr:aryl-sulfate sulfotransferase [Rhodospirillaceae bacterium]